MLYSISATVDYLAISFLFGLITGTTITYFVLSQLTENVVPRNLIPFKNALHMIKNRNNKPNETGFKEAEFGFLELEDFTKYIDYLKSECKKSKVELTGLSYHFARYSNTVFLDDEHKNHRTLVFFPTRKNEKGKDIPFDPQNLELDVLNAIQQSDASSSTGNNDGIIEDSDLTGLGDQIMSVCYNKSQMSPPRSVA